MTTRCHNGQRHTYDVAPDGQSARCSCGDVLQVELPPPWAEEVADIVAPDAWAGEMDDHSLGVSYTANWWLNPADQWDVDLLMDIDDDPRPQVRWEVSDCMEITLEDDGLRLTADSDEDSLPEDMRRLLAARTAFHTWPPPEAT